MRWATARSGLRSRPHRGSRRGRRGPPASVLRSGRWHARVDSPVAAQAGPPAPGKQPAKPPTRRAGEARPEAVGSRCSATSAPHSWRGALGKTVCSTRAWRASAGRVRNRSCGRRGAKPPNPRAGGLFALPPSGPCPGVGAGRPRKRGSQNQGPGCCSRCAGVWREPERGGGGSPQNPRL